MSVEAKLEGIEALLKVIQKQVESLEARARPEPTCFSLKDAATRLGVSLSTMKRMVAEGEIQTATIGKREMIPLSELTRVSTPDTQRPAQQKAAKAAAWVSVPKKRAR